MPSTGLPSPGQDSSVGRPSLISKRRQYPTQVNIKTYF
jgi:hypothetical protein